jgi:hypothetical protein
VLSNYCRLETRETLEDQEKMVGKYIREHQLTAACASTQFKSGLYVREALSAQNVKLLDKSKLVYDSTANEYRVTELTPLMVACMLSNMQTSRILVEHAKALYLPHSPEDFRLFIDVKIAKDAGGGNNALLYACNASGTDDNYLLVSYLIDEAGADPNISNDMQQSALLLATKRNQLNVVDLLFSKDVDINQTDTQGCK